ncbi:hypothetical protein C5167_036540 [Papaver somniferum]|uniref:Uncharacterized protein n=1 Tax=Papaver somniferum TaxID=3469 RepID=A0A4Y7I4B3_PAPSO|nr:hypothetical protein C5167_036540 [Papaver somniferum]
MVETIVGRPSRDMVFLSESEYVEWLAAESVSSMGGMGKTNHEYIHLRNGVTQPEAYGDEPEDDEFMYNIMKSVASTYQQRQIWCELSTHDSYWHKDRDEAVEAVATGVRPLTSVEDSRVFHICKIGYRDTVERNSSPMKHRICVKLDLT